MFKEVKNAVKGLNPLINEGEATTIVVETEEQKIERLEKERLAMEEDEKKREQTQRDYQRKRDETEIMSELPKLVHPGYGPYGFKDTLKEYAERKRSNSVYDARLADIAEELAKKFEPKVWRE